MEEFKSLKIDHIAVAVPNIKEVYPFYEMAGFTDFHDEIVESEKVNTRSMHAGNSKIELIEPISEDSPIKKFLEKRGPGLHHICLKVSNIKEKAKELKEKGCNIIGDVHLGAGNCLIVFVHPKSTGGVLIELSQPLGDSENGV